MYSLIKQKLPLHMEISFGEDDLYGEGKLCESLLSSSSSSNSESFESVDETALSRLQTNHGDVSVSVRFKKIAVKFFTIVRSPAIRVPHQVIKAKDIQIRSSPVAGGVVGSGDWIDMTQQQQLLPSSNKQHKRYQSNAQTNTTMGQIKILTTAHKPTSSLVPDSSLKQHRHDLSDFIKTFEKVPDTLTSSTPPSMSPSHLIQLLEASRSKKIHFDRWLEELEIENEVTMMKMNEFDLVNDME